MKKTATAALVVLLALTATGCGQDEKGAAPASAATQEAADEKSFASFMMGTWKCDGQTEYANAELRTPGMNGWNFDLDELKIVIGDGTLKFTEYDGNSAEVDWEAEGRTVTVTSLIGTQIIENMPETFEYALEPVDIDFVGTDGRDSETLRIQALGERQLSISDSEFTSICVKS